MLDASAPLTVTDTIKDDDGEPDPVTIGALLAGGTNSPAELFLGQVDEVEYFNRALSASEIQDIYNAGSAGKCKPPGVRVAPTGTFLHTVSDSPGSPTIVDLGAAGFAPGDVLELTYEVPPPGFSFFGCGGPFVGAEDTGVLGVFSSSSTLLSPSALARVPDAIEAGPDYVTGPTFFGNEPSDIPQDFRLFPPSGFTVAVPVGATHLFLGVADSFYGDNCGPIIVTINAAAPSDSTPPTFGDCPVGGPFLLNSGLQLFGPISAEDLESGINAGASTLSGSVDTGSVGAKTVTFVAVNNVGLQTTKDCNYNVNYNFGGFFQPIDNNVPNSAKAGQTIPIKWRLTDANGVPISDPSSFVSVTSSATPGACGGSADAIETYAGSSGLQYLGSGNWQFNWKTPASYKGQCRTMSLNLNDGAPGRTAAFIFK